MDEEYLKLLKDIDRQCQLGVKCCVECGAKELAPFSELCVVCEERIIGYGC